MCSVGVAPGNALGQGDFGYVRREGMRGVRPHCRQRLFALRCRAERVQMVGEAFWSSGENKQATITQYILHR